MEHTIQLKGYSCTDTDGTPGQGQMGVEEFCPQWPVLQDGVNRTQIRSERLSNCSSYHHLIFDILQWYKPKEHFTKRVEIFAALQPCYSFLKDGGKMVTTIPCVTCAAIG